MDLCFLLTYKNSSHCEYNKGMFLEEPLHVESTPGWRCIIWERAAFVTHSVMWDHLTRRVRRLWPCLLHCWSPDLADLTGEKKRYLHSNKENSGCAGNHRLLPYRDFTVVWFCLNMQWHLVYKVKQSSFAIQKSHFIYCDFFFF